MATVKGEGRRLDAHPADHLYNRLACPKPRPRTDFNDVLVKTRNMLGSRLIQIQ
jgi:hypothetical protein